MSKNAARRSPHLAHCRPADHESRHVESVPKSGTAPAACSMTSGVKAVAVHFNTESSRHGTWHARTLTLGERAAATVLSGLREGDVANPLVMKFEHAAVLNDDDRAKLHVLCRSPQRVKKRATIIQAGDRPEDVHLILRGFACRMKYLPSGRRQIMALLIPGDFCDLNAGFLDAMDYNIVMLSPGMIVNVSQAAVEELRSHPRIMPALWWAALVDEAISREWLVNMGQREADQRIAHLICEIYMRLALVGLVDDNAFNMSITQEEIGEMVGLSTVHVNRTVQYLRAEGFITWKAPNMVIHDLPRFKEFADFQDDYLHLKRRAG